MIRGRYVWCPSEKVRDSTSVSHSLANLFQCLYGKNRSETAALLVGADIQRHLLGASQTLFASAIACVHSRTPVVTLVSSVSMFALNGQRQAIDNVAPSTVLYDFLRSSTPFTVRLLTCFDHNYRSDVLALAFRGATHMIQARLID